MPNRKTVSVDVLRQLLGDSQTDELLEKLAPAKPTIAVDARSVHLARSLFAYPLTDSNDWADTLPVVRRYFLDHGRSRRAFLGWLDRVSTDGVDGGAARVPEEKVRRRVTDPEQLERRRAAMAKAREARRRNLEARRRRSD